MTKIEFINKVVHGYIQKDLENMKSYLPRKPGEEGNNNFPIALVVLSYMEYLGSFFTSNDFSPEENIKEYIDKCFNRPDEYYPAILTFLFRHGLAHDYFARGGVTRDGNRPAMYKNYENKAILDAETLLNDFLESLNKFADVLSDDFYDKRMRIAGKKIAEIEENHRDQINKLRSLSELVGVHTSGATTYPVFSTTTLPYGEKV